MKTERKVYLNGEFVAEADARISIFDSALMFGDMVFEVLRTYNGQPFRLREHLIRLYAGLKILEIDCGLTIDEMEAATLKTLAINEQTNLEKLDWQIMHNVSRGPLGLYSPVFPEGMRPTVAINCWPLPRKVAGTAAAYERGLHAITPPQHSVPARLIDPKIKNRSRVYYQVANLQVAKMDAQAWPLLTDEEGFITEGTGANFFIVKDKQMLTPEPRNILRGVTRQAVLDLATQLKIPWRECNLEPYDVVTADEAFFTATSFAILPVTQYNHHPIADGVPGPVTKLLIESWSQMVEVDIVAQAKAYAQMV